MSLIEEMSPEDSKCQDVEEKRSESVQEHLYDLGVLPSKQPLRKLQWNPIARFLLGECLSASVLGSIKTNFHNFFTRNFVHYCEERIQLLNQLIDHPHLLVRDWVKEEIESYGGEIKKCTKKELEESAGIHHSPDFGGILTSSMTSFGVREPAVKGTHSKKRKERPTASDENGEDESHAVGMRRQCI
jgi:hypothetical protein